MNSSFVGFGLKAEPFQEPDELIFPDVTATEQRDDFPTDVGSFALEVLLELPGFVGMKLGGLVILAPQYGVLPDPRFHACAQASLDQQPANFADQDGLKPQCVREKRENTPGDLFDLRRDSDRRFARRRGFPRG